MSVLADVLNMYIFFDEKKRMSVELYGTIRTVYPLEYTEEGTLQKVLLNNISTTNRAVSLPPQVLLEIKLLTNNAIPFRIGDPITVRGTIDRTVVPPIVRNAHHPVGYIRYNGKIYR